jgi:predicted DNA binding protein
MSIVAEFTIDADAFLLGEVLGRDPIARIEMERVIPTSHRIMPYVWVHGDEFDEFEASIRTSDQIDALVQLDRTDESALYRITWEDEAKSLIDGMAETDATVLEARGKEQWYFRIRFDSHSGLTDFHDFCRAHGIAIELDRVYTSTDKAAPADFELTDSQRSALFHAVRGGYFEVPRRTTLRQIGDELGITGQAVSENLRRGANNVFEQVLLGPSESDSA